MKVMKIIVLCLLSIFMLSFPHAIAENEQKEMLPVEYYDNKIHELENRQSELLELLQPMGDIVDKANSGDYYILFPMSPIKKSLFESIIQDRILKAGLEGAGLSSVYADNTRLIQSTIAYTKYIANHGGQLVEKWRNELDQVKSSLKYYIGERDRVKALTAGTSPTAGGQSGASSGVSTSPTGGGHRGDIAYLHLVGQPEVTWGTEDRRYRDCFTDVNVEACSVTYKPDPKDISVHGSFTMTWDEPPKTIGRNGLDWGFNAKISSMPKGNDGCGIKVKFSDFFRAAGAEQWAGIGQDGTQFNGDKITVKLQPDIDALGGEMDAWINIEIYYLYITYHFKVTRDAAPPPGIR